MEDWAIIVLGVAVSLIGGYSGVQWVKYRALDASYVMGKVKIYKDMSKEYEDEAKHWKGKFNQTKQLLQVEGDFDMGSDEGITQFITALAGKFAPMLPREAQSFLNDPKMIQQGIALYRQNPELAKSILSKFIKKGSQNQSQGQKVLQESL